MGIFPGAKKYFRRVSNTFRASAPIAQVYVTDLMLHIYSYVPRETNTVADFALHLWKAVHRPDDRVFAPDTVHVVTFDIPIPGFLAKSITQAKRNAHQNASATPFELVDDTLPSQTPDCFRDRPFMTTLIPRVVARFIELYQMDISVQGTLIVQYSQAPVKLTKSAAGVTVTYLNNCTMSCNIPEGDMSIAYWITHFGAEHTMVITKDTDMLCILPYVYSPQRRVTLKLYHGATVDYIDMNAFTEWLQQHFGSIYTGTLMITLQGNDYVNKCTMGCSAEKFLDTYVSIKPGAVIDMHDGQLRLDEKKCLDFINLCTIRGRIVTQVQANVRQAFWYLMYTLSSINGLTNCHANCTTLHEGQSVYGWRLNDITGKVEVAHDIFKLCPIFQYEPAYAL